MDDSIDIVDYSRQESMDKILDNYLTFRNVIIIGCGGIGFWAGILLAMKGVPNFILIDGDKIEATNLNRLPVPQTWVGTNKAVALRKMIRILRPSTVISAIARHVQHDEIDILKRVIQDGGPYYQLLIDTTDDARIQKAIYEAMKDRHMYTKYVKIGYEGFKVGAYNNMSVWIPEDYRPGYRTTQANALSSAGAAVIGILSAFFMDENDKDLDVDLSKISGRKRKWTTKETNDNELFYEQDSIFAEIEQREEGPR